MIFIENCLFNFNKSSIEPKLDAWNVGGKHVLHMKSESALQSEHLSNHYLNMQNQSSGFGSFSIAKKPAPKRPPPFPSSGGAQKKQKTTNDDSDSSVEGDQNVEEMITSPEEKVRKESIMQQMTNSQMARHEAFAQSTFYKTQKKTIKTV